MVLQDGHVGNHFQLVSSAFCGVFLSESVQDFFGFVKFKDKRDVLHRWLIFSHLMPILSLKPDDVQQQIQRHQRVTGTVPVSTWCFATL